MRQHILPELESLVAHEIPSPIAPLLDSPESARGDTGSSTSDLLPHVPSPPSNPHGSLSHDNFDLDFVSFKPTPTSRTSPADSPKDNLKFFESQTTLSPTWSQPRSFEKWRLRDSEFYNGQHAFGDGKAGLEAEAEGHEPGEESRTADGEESEESEKGVSLASSVTEEESQDATEWLLRVNPGLKYAGKAPPCKPSPSSRKSGSDSTRDNGNERRSGSQVEESEPQSGGSGEAQDRAPTNLNPLTVFLDMFEGGSSMPYNL